MPVIGITGSAGKTTTTTLVGLMLTAAGYADACRRQHRHAVDRPSRQRARSATRSSWSCPVSSSSCSTAARPWRLCSTSRPIIWTATLDEPLRGGQSQHPALPGAGEHGVLNADDPYTGPGWPSGRCEIAAGQRPAGGVRFPLRGTRVGFSLEREVASGAFLAGDRLMWRQSGSARPGDLPADRTCACAGGTTWPTSWPPAVWPAAAGADADAMRAVATTFGASSTGSRSCESRAAYLGQRFDRHHPGAGSRGPALLLRTGRAAGRRARQAPALGRARRGARRQGAAGDPVRRGAGADRRGTGATCGGSRQAGSAGDPL